MQDSASVCIYLPMKNKLIIILALFCCSCAKPKYTDEPFFRLEYTLGGDRIVDEDYGRAERGVFGSYYESRMGGQCFCFKPVNDTVRLAGFDVTLEVKGNSAGDGFSFSVTSPEAFFICGKTYCYKNEAGIILLHCIITAKGITSSRATSASLACGRLPRSTAS